MTSYGNCEKIHFFLLLIPSLKGHDKGKISYLYSLQKSWKKLSISSGESQMVLFSVLWSYFFSEPLNDQIRQNGENWPNFLIKYFFYKWILVYDREKFPFSTRWLGPIGRYWYFFRNLWRLSQAYTNLHIWHNQ